MLQQVFVSFFAYLALSWPTTPARAGGCFPPPIPPAQQAGLTPNGGAGWAYGKAILSIPLGVNNEPHFKLKINSFGNLFGVKESEIKTKLYSCNSFTLKEVLGMLKKDYIIERELSRINKAKQKILKELEKVIK